MPRVGKPKSDEVGRVELPSVNIFVLGVSLRDNKVNVCFTLRSALKKSVRANGDVFEKDEQGWVASANLITIFLGNFGGGNIDKIVTNSLACLFSY